MIEHSLSGRRWVWRAMEENLACAIAQRGNIPDILGRLLAARGVRPDTVPDFLNPTLRRFLPDPSAFLNMDRATQRLARAVQSGETIAVFGDYDVDGACSAALLIDVLEALGCPAVLWHVPDRILEGYGPNRKALEDFVARGASVIVCVDCGTTAGAVLGELTGRADIVVLDHHRADDAPPDPVVTVNPNQPGCCSGHPDLCAAVIVFLAMVGLLRDLRREGFFASSSRRPEPDLLSYLDLVALATVCDVMPLAGVNRALVTQGLKVLGRNRRCGLAALMEAAQIRGHPDVFTCGYNLGPRINAAGRIDEAKLGVRLLLTRDQNEARSLATRLDAVNQQRRDVESATLKEALRQAEIQMARGDTVLLVHGDDWHPGIVGIVAGRLKERYHRPVCAAGGEILLKGSGRSLPGLDLGRAIGAAYTAGLLKTGGGHAMAAGFSILRENWEGFRDFLNRTLIPTETLPPSPDLFLDVSVTVSAATISLAEQLVRLAPFGNGNAEPILMLPHARILRADRVGREGTTIRAWIEGEGGGARLKGVMFRTPEGPLAESLLSRRAPLHLAGHLRREEWNGQETASFFILDAALA
jgi:single-stranded-DNA-specific exonuclease